MSKSENYTVRIVARSPDMLFIGSDLKGPPMYLPGVGSTNMKEQPFAGHIDIPLRDIDETDMATLKTHTRPGAARFLKHLAAHERTGRLALAIVEGKNQTPIKAADLAVLAAA